MKKDKINSKFREYARKLSPRQSEQNFIRNIYQSFRELLGTNNCIQVGSYARFTAITPVHDLDILYILGDWGDGSHDSTNILKQTIELIEKDYQNPTDYKVSTNLQTHSITVSYLDTDKEIFSVDIVPAYVYSKNEFNQDVYKVPEIVRQRHGRSRLEFYRKLSEERRDMGWITSDPRGYQKIATEVDEITNGEFRKTAKIIKKWKFTLDEADSELKLKSFHLEQVITRYFQNNKNMEIFDVVFMFFSDFPNIIDNPNQIKDRASNNKFIDDYLVEFSSQQKVKIRYARDYFLIKLENLKESDSIEDLFKIAFYRRKPNEAFLFDSEIKVLTDDNLIFKIDGYVKPLNGFSSGWLTKTPQLQKGLTCGEGQTRYIEFSIRENNTSAREYLWKVRNSDDCEEPRGEITLNQTKNNPERTHYVGNHFVECYAIYENICIARSKLNINII